MKKLPQILLLLACLAYPAGAGEVTAWTYDFQTPTASPDWVKIIPQKQDLNYLGRAEFEIAPAEGSSDLLFTLYFQESDGGFLRVFWNAGGSNTLLCQNLYEGIGKGLTNQRTLRLPGSWLRSGGVLSFQSSQSDLGISRIKLEWLTVQAIPVSQDLGTTIAAVDSNGRGLTGSELLGELEQVPTDQWKDNVITAQVTDRVEAFSDTVQFAFELESIPQRARVEAQLAGLPLDQGLTLWVNGKYAGSVSVPVPDLTDTGYQTSADGRVSYDGWRKGTILIQAELLQAGLNTLQFSRAGDAAATAAMALKNLKLQLKYPPAAATADSTNTSESGAPGTMSDHQSSNTSTPP